MVNVYLAFVGFVGRNSRTKSNEKYEWGSYECRAFLSMIENKFKVHVEKEEDGVRHCRVPWPSHAKQSDGSRTPQWYRMPLTNFVRLVADSVAAFNWFLCLASNELLKAKTRNLCSKLTFAFKPCSHFLSKVIDTQFQNAQLQIPIDTCALTRDQAKNACDWLAYLSATPTKMKEAKNKDAPPNFPLGFLRAD